MIQTIQTWFHRLAAGGSTKYKLNEVERQALLLDLAAEQPGRRLRAMQTLANADIRNEEIAALAQLLTAANPVVRSEAALTLARSATPEARSALLAATASIKPLAQAAAADALAILPTEEDSIEALIALLLSRDGVVRQSAGEALARMTPLPAHKDGSPSAPNVQVTLVKLLSSDKAPMVRRAAALALGKWGNQEAESLLIAHRDDEREDWRVREAAGVALAAMAAHLPTPSA